MFVWPLAGIDGLCARRKYTGVKPQGKRIEQQEIKKNNNKSYRIL